MPKSAIEGAITARGLTHGFFLHRPLNFLAVFCNRIGHLTNFELTLRSP